MTRQRRGMAAAVVVALTLAGAVLRFFGLGSRPLWLDEAAAARNVGLLQESGLATLARIDHVPPLVFLLQSWSTSAFGTTEWALRLPAAVAGTTTIPVVYLLAERVSPRRGVAIGAAALEEPRTARPRVSTTARR